MESKSSESGHSALNKVFELAQGAQRLRNQIKAIQNDEDADKNTIPSLMDDYCQKLATLKAQLQQLSPDDLLKMDKFNASIIATAIGSQLSMPEGSFVCEVETIGADHRALGSGTPDKEFLRNCFLARIFAFIGQEVPSQVKKVIRIQQIVDKKTKELLPSTDGGRSNPLSPQNQASVVNFEALLKCLPESLFERPIEEIEAVVNRDVLQSLPASLFERPIDEISAVVNGLLALDEKQHEPDAVDNASNSSLEAKSQPVSPNQDQAITAITELYNQVSIGFQANELLNAISDLEGMRVQVSQRDGEHPFPGSTRYFKFCLMSLCAMKKFNQSFQSRPEKTLSDMMTLAEAYWMSGMLADEGPLDQDQKRVIKSIFSEGNFLAAKKQYILEAFKKIYPDLSTQNPGLVVRLIVMLDGLDEDGLQRVAMKFYHSPESQPPTVLFNIMENERKSDSGSTDINYIKSKIGRQLMYFHPAGIDPMDIQKLKGATSVKELKQVCTSTGIPFPGSHDSRYTNDNDNTIARLQESELTVSQARREYQSFFTEKPDFGKALNLQLKLTQLKKSSNISQQDMLDVIGRLQGISADDHFREDCFLSSFKSLLTCYFKQHHRDSEICGNHFFPEPAVSVQQEPDYLTDDRLNVISYVMSNDYIYSSLCLEEGESTLDSIKKSENLVLFFSNLSIDARKAAVNSVFGERYVAEFVADIFKDLQGLYKARKILQEKIDSLESECASLEKIFPEKLFVGSKLEKRRLVLATNAAYDKLSILKSLKQKCEENITDVLRGEVTNARKFKNAVQKELTNENSKLQETRDCGFWRGFFNKLLSIFSSRKTKSAAVVDDAFAAVNSGAGFFRSAEESVSASSALSFEPSSVARFGDYDEESDEESDEVLGSEVSRRFSQ